MAEVKPSIEMQSKGSRSSVVGKGLSWSNIRFEVPVRIFYKFTLTSLTINSKFSHYTYACIPLSLLTQLTRSYAHLLHTHTHLRNARTTGAKDFKGSVG